MVTHRNRHGDLYYLHEGKTETGKPKYFFSRKRDGVLVKEIPAGFETYESPNALVLLRRKTFCPVTDDELQKVRDAVRQNRKAARAIVEAKSTAVTVFMPNMDPEESADELIRDWPLHDRATLVATLKRSVYYSPMMRFVLEDEKTRTYQAERWCVMGPKDDWIPVGSPGPLSRLARQFCRHLGKDSFFELV